MEQAFTHLLTSIGENPERSGLKKTPARAAEALRFLTQGYQQSAEDIVNDALFDSNASEMILVKNIELYSMCEHHMLPFVGKCHVVARRRSRHDRRGLRRAGLSVHAVARRDQTTRAEGR